jgi:hypothetical protein
MLPSGKRRKLLWSGLSGICWLGCLSSARLAPQPADPSAGGATPETLTAPAPPDTPSTRAAADSAPVSDPTECVAPPDPELDQESDWSKELGQRLDAVLPSLRSCSRDLPRAEAAELTLRLVYAQDGTGTSQFVVSSTPSGCQVVDCVKKQLATVRSPKLLIPRASYDLALVLEPGAAPRRGPPPEDALAEGPVDDPSSCVDPAVARLSRPAVHDIVSSSFDGLKACYAQALTRNHSATGTVTFEFVIGQEGKVAEARARDATLQDCDAIRCMLEQFRTLEFPAPVGRSVRVLYPINYLVEQSPVTLR